MGSERCIRDSHDGFCMFDSKLTDYTIMNGPCKRDLIGEVADACPVSYTHLTLPTIYSV